MPINTKQNKKEHDQLADKLTTSIQDAISKGLDTTDLDALANRAREMYDEGATRSDWMQLADVIGRSLARLGMAQAGARAGVDTSGVQLEAPINFATGKQEAGRRLDTELEQVGQAKRTRLEGAKLQADAIREGIKAKMELPKIAYTKGLEEEVNAEKEKIRKASTPLRRDYRYMTKSGGQVWTDSEGNSYGVGRRLLSEGEAIPASKEAIDQLAGQGKSDYDTLAPNKRHLIDTASRQFETEIKPIKTSLDGTAMLMRTLKLSEEGNKSATSQVGTMLAKMLQPSDRLSDRDLAIYIGRPDWEGQINSKIKLAADGKFPQDQIADLKEIAQGMVGLYTTRLEERALAKAKSIEKRVGLPSEKIIPMFYLPTIDTSKVEPTLPEGVTDADVDEALKQAKTVNPNATRESVIRILNSRAKANTNAK